MENHMVRAQEEEQLIMIKRLYYYSVSVFLSLCESKSNHEIFFILLYFNNFNERFIFSKLR